MKSIQKDRPKKTDIPRRIGFDQVGCCTLRLNPRSRYIRLSFHKKNGLILTSPIMLNDQQIEHYLQKHHHWLEKIQASLAANHCQHDLLQQLMHHQSLDFMAIPQQISLTVEPDDQAMRLYLKEQENQLILSGATANTEKIRTALRRWLNKKADLLLSPIFLTYAKHHGFTPRSVTWKTLSSRWGSCTSQGKINLNSKLLFLPLSLVNYIFAHELSHLVEMNHSQRFYDVLESLLPDYQLREMSLKTQQKRLPVWLSLL